MSHSYREQQKRLLDEMVHSFSVGKVKSTVVAMCSDYENDNRLCLTSVVNIPEHTAKLIQEKIQVPLKAVEPDHFYYPPETMHLTIKNVRTISWPPLFTEDDVIKVKAVFQKIVPASASFDFSFERVMPFPTSVSLVGYSSDRLKILVQSLDCALTEVGVPDNKKYFSDSLFFGNITFCRFTREPGEEFKQKINELESSIRIEVPVKEIHLVICNSVNSLKSRVILDKYNLL